MKKAESFFAGRKLVIGTMHDKEKVIAPIIEKVIGVNCFRPDNFDTDLLGTFTGEIDRPDDPLMTVRKKCLAAMDAANCDLGIASEGSFGPHPTAFFLPADDELMIFIDRKYGIEVIARELSTSTNFSTEEIGNEKQLLDFAARVGFPSHGLILRNSPENNSAIIKGITDPDILKKEYHRLNDLYGKVSAQTDMRAMFNPSRMAVIKSLTQKLADNLLSCCPKCEMPGFNIVEVKSGLPCQLCHSSTRSILSHIYECKHCNFIEEKLYPNNKEYCDPMYCDQCNP
jgi:hypothetical protein